MTYQVSPGVYPTEINLSTSASSSATAIGGFVGNFKWGPVEQQISVSSESDLFKNFLAPDQDTEVDYLVAASYLAYSSSLTVFRAYDATNALNATTLDAATPGAGSGLLVKNANDYSSKIIPAGTEYIAKYPGAFGNSLAVVMVANKQAVTDAATKLGSASSSADKNMYGSIVSAIGRTNPGTSTFASKLDALNDQIHLFVVDYAGAFTGVPGTILESYMNVSLASNVVDASGVSLYYVNVLNTQSKYVWWGNHPSFFGAAGKPAAAGVNFQLNTSNTTTVVQKFGGGNNGTYPLTSAAYVSAYNFFTSKTISVDYLIMGQQTSVPTLNAIQNIAEVRKDCIVFASPAAADVINAATPRINCITYRDNTLDSSGSSRTDTLAGYNSTYAFLDNNWKYMYNKYNNAFVWVPCNGDTAGLTAATALSAAPWYSPAGYSRGLVKNAVKLAWNPNDADRDDLYSAQINPIVSQPNVGIVLLGDITLTSQPSAFQHINVRSLFIVLETTIDQAAKYSLFEFNNQFTQARFVALIDPFLRDVKGRLGVQDYYVQCDSTNNTPEIIDSNSFVGSIYVKPSRSINYIRLNFVAVGTSVDFTTVVGSF